MRRRTVLRTTARTLVVGGVAGAAGCSEESADSVEREIVYTDPARPIELGELEHAFDVRFSLAVIEGVATNTGEQPKQVSITAEYFTGAGELMTTTQTAAVPGEEPLDPGESVAFDTGFNGEVEKVTRYVLRVDASPA